MRIFIFLLLWRADSFVVAPVIHIGLNQKVNSLHVVVNKKVEDYQMMPKVSALPRRWAQTDSKRRAFSAAEEAKLILLAREEQRLQLVAQNFRKEKQRLPTVSEWARADNMSISSLARRRDAAKAAKRALVEAHTGLVRSVARNFVQRPSIPFSVLDDLVQEGTIGLIHAIDKFDPSKGARLSTYAQPWIRVTMTEWLRRSKGAFEIPKRMVDVSVKADTIVDQFQTEHGRQPSKIELEKSIGVNSQRLKEVKFRSSAARNALSIEGGGPEGKDATEMLAHNDDDDHLYALRRDLLRALEQALDDKQMRVVRLRYGLDDGQTRSTRECAALLGISAETVRMTCLRAFRNLRGTPLGDALLDYMD